MMYAPHSLIMVLMLLQSTGCQRSQANSGLATAQMQLGNQTFTLEIANTHQARERGLMKRDSMPADQGMIFVFPREQLLSFWMKNTRIALDIIYVDEQQRVVGIKQMKPYDLTPTPSPKPAKWAIELNKGSADAAGIKVGDQLKIPEAAKDVAD